MVIEEFSKKSSSKKVAVVVARLHSQGPEYRYRPESGRSDTGQSSRTVQSNSSVQSWTLHEKYTKYPITQFIAHECFMA